jgi:hypothetical protein
MTLERYIRLIAGTFVLASLAWGLGSARIGTYSPPSWA